MAKGGTIKSGTSKIRFIMLEAELSDGDLTQVTQAIQNALRPTPSVRYVALPTTQSPDTGLVDFTELDIDEDAEIDEAAVKVSAPQKPRKVTFRTPEIVEVDAASDPSLAEYTEQHPAKSTAQKFLVILAWFKEARSVSSVSVDQVYTCFKRLKWSTAMKDFSQPLRDLKSQQLIGGNSKDGFVINHVGLDRVANFGKLSD